MTVHHGTLDIQFMIVGYRQIDLRHASEYSYQYDHASFSRVFDRLSHGDIISCAVVNHICFIRAESFYHGFSEILILCIYTHVDAALFCLFQTQIADIRDHNFGCSHSFSSLCNEITDGACTDNYDVHTGHITHLFYPMNRNCQRLDHGSFLIRHFLGDWGHLGCIYRKIF